jgi:hypothetical protein
VKPPRKNRGKGGEENGGINKKTAPATGKKLEGLKK